MPQTVTRLPSRPARPTIEVAGEQQTRLEAALLEYALSDAIDSMANAELRFGNWGGEQPGFQWFDRQLLDFGKEIVVKQGGEVLFAGKITAINAHYPQGRPPELSIFAEDRLQDLRMTRRTRAFAAKGLADIARIIASDHGLTPEISVYGPSWKALAQVAQSDLAFLIDLARREDAMVWIDQGKLVVKRTRDVPAVSLAWAGTLRAFDVSADLTTQRTALLASGWNVADKKVARHEADKAALGSELGQDQAGGEILQQAFGARKDQVAHLVPANDAEAKTLAEAGYRHLARNFVIGEGECETDPLLRVGAKLSLTGLGPLFDGDYRIRARTHLFDAAEGARSQFTCDRPGLGRG